MPYIKQENRKEWKGLAKVVSGVITSLPENIANILLKKEKVEKVVAE